MRLQTILGTKQTQAKLQKILHDCTSHSETYKRADIHTEPSQSHDISQIILHSHMQASGEIS